MGPYFFTISPVSVTQLLHYFFHDDLMHTLFFNPFFYFLQFIQSALMYPLPLFTFMYILLVNTWIYVYNSNLICCGQIYIYINIQSTVQVFCMTALAITTSYTLLQLEYSFSVDLIQQVHIFYCFYNQYSSSKAWSPLSIILYLFKFFHFC